MQVRAEETQGKIKCNIEARAREIVLYEMIYI